MCEYCHSLELLSANRFTIDHIIPRSLGGSEKKPLWNHVLKSQFLQFKQQIDRVLFSIVQVADFSLAQELYYQVGEQKHSLHKLAAAYSQHPTATIGGIVGPICLSQLSPIIIQNITGIAPKRLSRIFKLDEDYIFIRVERWLPAQCNEQTEQLLLDRLFFQWLQTQLRDRIYALVKDSRCRSN